jgi:hypothetical protein
MVLFERDSHGSLPPEKHPGTTRDPNLALPGGQEKKANFPQFSLFGRNICFYCISIYSVSTDSPLQDTDDSFEDPRAYSISPYSAL